MVEFVFNFFYVMVEKQVPGTYEKARLRFSHAETLIPFTCLLGLFLEEGKGTLIFFNEQLQINQSKLKYQ